MQGQQLPYEDMCKLIGDLHISAYAQSMQARNLIQQLTQENAQLREENKRLQENPLCQKNFSKENT
jgi:hypothetical protein